MQFSTILGFIFAFVMQLASQLLLSRAFKKLNEETKQELKDVFSGGTLYKILGFVLVALVAAYFLAIHYVSEQFTFFTIIFIVLYFALWFIAFILLYRRISQTKVPQSFYYSFILAYFFSFVSYTFIVSSLLSLYFSGVD